MSKPFVITGASSGIGQALAWQLASLGHSVVAIARRDAQLQQTKAKFPDLIETLVADLSEQSAINMIKKQLDQYQRLAGLIHNAGQLQPLGSIRELSYQQWRQIAAINLEAPIFLSQALLEQLSGGRILHVSSGVAHFPVAKWLPYCTTKAALHMVTRCLQTELNDVAVGSAQPGIVDTTMQQLILHHQSLTREEKTFYQQTRQQGLQVSPTTVAKFFSWLLLDTADQDFCAQEWDIYDKSHHHHWLGEEQAPTIFTSL